MLKAIGVTCGVGSMLIGARDAGFKVVGNVEFRPYYHHRDSEGRNTFEMNFPGAIFVKKFEDLTPEQVETMTGADIAFGHPECGNYSVMSSTVKRKDGRSAKEMHGDPGDIPLFCELIHKLKPRFFAMDDLPAAFVGFPMSEYHKLLPDYDLFPEWISNHNYGNIQKFRRRFFMVGALKTEKFVFRPDEFENQSTMESVIGDLIGMEGKIPNHYHHCLDGNTSKGKGLLGIEDRHLTFGELQTWLSEQPGGTTVKYRKANGDWGLHVGVRKGHWGGACPVLHGGHPIYHPVKNLPLTVRERARLQGAPDDFIFYGEKIRKDGTWNHYENQALIKQTGKFMPVHFCRAFALQVAHHINGSELGVTGERVLKPEPFVNDAKRWYCKNVGYSDQARACEHCHINKECEGPQLSIPEE